MKFELSVFGGAVLGREGEIITSLTRRPLMLLCLLACRGGSAARRVSRDQLLVLLWPESREARARNSLNQALRAIRNVLGSDAVVGSTDLSLDPDRIRCDRWTFDELMKRGEFEAAIALRSTGPLLEGMSLPGLTELDEWIEAERRRVDEQYRNAIEALASALESRDELQAALPWWRLLLAESPTTAIGVRGIMRSLEAAGDLPEAVLQGQRYIAAMNELGVPPHPEVAAHVAACRARLAEPLLLSRPRDETRQPHGRPPQDLLQDAERDDIAPDSPPAPASRTSAEHEAPAPSTRWHIRPQVMRIAAAIIWMVAGAGAFSLTRGAPSLQAFDPGDTSPATVLVLPAIGRSAAVHEHAASFAGLVAANLGGVRMLRAHSGATASPQAGDGAQWIDNPDAAAASALQNRAHFYLVSEVIGDAQHRIRIRAQLFDTRTGAPIGESSVSGTGDDLFALADTIASTLLQRWADVHGLAVLPDDRPLRTPLPALKAYLRGEHALRHDRYANAIDAYREALDMDSTLGLAWYRMSVAADWDGQSRLANQAAVQARRHLLQLPAHERTLLLARAAWREGNAQEAERLYQLAVEQEPLEAEGWIGLGEVRFHSGPLQGRPVTLARSAFERALHLDSLDIEATVHLARIAAIEGRRRDAAALMAHARRINTDSAMVNMRAFRAVTLGGRPEFSRASREIFTGSDRSGDLSVLGVAVYPDDIASSERFARALIRADRPPEVRVFGHQLLAQLAFATGNVARAERALAAAMTLDPVAALELRALAATIPELGFSPDSIRAIQAAIARWDADGKAGDARHADSHSGLHPLIRLHRLGILSARLADTTAALDAIARLEAAADPESRLVNRTLASSVRAHMYANCGRPADALQGFRNANWLRTADEFTGEAADRFARAGVLATLGRTDDALGWYESMAQRATYELMYLAPSQLRMAELLEARGERTRAIAHYDRFLSLWEKADSRLQPIVTRAKTRRAALAAGGATGSR